MVKLDELDERTNEQQLEFFADLIEPVAEILGDKELRSAVKGGGTAARAVSLAIKSHKPACVRILAAIDGEDAATYCVPDPIVLASKLFSLAKLIYFKNKQELQELFMSPEATNAAVASGSVTENTEGGAN